MRWFWPLLSRLGSRTLMTLVGVLFVIDLFVPDPLPFVDEIILGVTTLLLSRRRRASTRVGRSPTLID
jgi:hypothetical protein